MERYEIRQYSKQKYYVYDLKELCIVTYPQDREICDKWILEKLKENDIKASTKHFVQLTIWDLL